MSLITMSNDPDRIELLVSEKRVKLHLFEPSQRKIWTVVGKGEEHWVDPDCGFCSCPGFYFGQLNGKISCYHLDSAQLAKRENKIEQVIFSDDEFSDFLFSLISDL
jgi:predicted nucleic acid-binding Zn finger protein